MRHNFSLRVRLFALPAVVLALVVAGQLLFGAFFARSYLIEGKKHQIEGLFGEITENYTDDPRQLYTLLRTGEDVDNIRVTIWSGDGIIYTSRPMDGVAVPPIPTQTLQFSREPSATEFHGRNPQESVLCLAGLVDTQTGIRYVVLWTMVEAVEHSVQLWNQVSLYIVAMVLAAGLIVSVWMARSISKPIEQIQKVSRQMAQLDFSTKAEEQTGVQELSELAVSVNQMADHLEASIQQLQADVDRQKKLEQMRREFVANVSHEMKTPLCLLQMYAENLKYNVEGIDREEYCSIIIDEVERLNELVAGMLELSTVENDLADMAHTPIELGELVQHVLTRMAPVLSHCQVIRNFQGAFPILGDQKYLEMAVGNFLSNAATHTKEGGQVRVSLKEQENWIVLTVENQGEQIPEERMNRLWDSFYKVDQSRVRTGETHAGLGLAIVKQVVQRHGGSCQVCNLSDGVAFSFQIPKDNTSKFI